MEIEKSEKRTLDRLSFSAAGGANHIFNSRIIGFEVLNNRGDCEVVYRNGKSDMKRTINVTSINYGIKRWVGEDCEGIGLDVKEYMALGQPKILEEDRTSKFRKKE